jgi:peroxiredoxin
MNRLFSVVLVALLTQVGCIGLNRQAIAPTSPVASPSGPTAAPFTLPDADNQPVSLEALQKEGPVVVVFSRGAWCPFCVGHLKALAASHERFRSVGARVVSVSTDTPPRSKRFAKEASIPYPLLSDIDGAVARQYGVLMQGADDSPVSVPAVFIVQRDGRIAWSAVGDYPWSTVNADELLTHLPAQ